MARDDELKDVLNALKGADEAGNTEDASQLAQIADRLIKSKPTETIGKPTSIGEAPAISTLKEKPTSYLPKGLARSFGAPVDIISAGLGAVGLGVDEPFGGSKSIESGLRAIGLDIPKRPPKSVGEHIYSGVGEATGMLIPGVLGMKALSRGTGIAANIAKQIYGTMVKHPTAAVATEITGGVGMGAGRKIGEEHPELGMVPELVGGIVGGMAPTAINYMPSRLAFKAAKKVAEKVSLPFTEAGARYRAGEFIKKQVADPTATTKTLAVESISGLPPVAMTGEKRLMALYNQVKSLDPATDAKAIEQITKVAFKLEREMRVLGRGSPEILKDMTEKRIASIELGMDNRIAKRMEAVQRKVDSLPVAQRQSQESIIVRNELTKVMHEERELVKKTWLDVPRKVTVEVKNTKAAFAKISEELATAQKSDIPIVLRNHMVLKEDVTSTTVNEMQGLRSKLLEVSRQARANSQWNKSRIAEDMADAILEDMTISAGKTVTPEGELLNTALASTKQFKQRFEQGTVGKILGYERTSAPSIAPELTLDIATRGKGIVDINKVVVTPEARIATEKYIARSFTDYSLDPNGAVSPAKVQKFLRNNEELLDSFPNLRKQMENIGGAQKLATATKTTMEARKAALRDPKVSAAGRFLNTNVGDEIKGILKSSNPALLTKQLVNQARKDTTGQAVEGLRGGFIEHILDKSSIGGFNDLGEKTLSGRTILGFIKDNNNVLNQVFSSEQIGRMNRIGQELAKIETLEQTRGMGIEFSDTMSNLLKFASRFGGAAAGRHWGKMVGAGGTVQIPGFFAQQWHKIATSLTKDRFEKLVYDAIVSPDKKLLEALLMPINKPVSMGGKSKEVAIRLNAWLMATGNQVLQDIIAEEGEPEPTQTPIIPRATGGTVSPTAIKSSMGRILPFGIIGTKGILSGPDLQKRELEE